MTRERWLHLRKHLQEILPEWTVELDCLFADREKLRDELAGLVEALRQVKRGRECSARNCQAPLGGACTCGNANLCSIVNAALASLTAPAGEKGDG